MRSHVERTINEPEAETVRRIFALCAAGKGLKGIAKLLNDRGISSPRPRQGRPRAWAPSSVRSTLHNNLYRGVFVWNKTKQSDAWGKRKCQARPESDWIRVDVPNLRIVTNEEWNAAHHRIQSAAAVYLRRTNGQVWGRPPSGIESKYLLSGMMACALCGQSMIARSSSHGRQFYFVCASYDCRGRAVCTNGLRLPMKRAEEAILSKVSDYVLDPDIVEGAIADAILELRPSRDKVDAKRTVLQAEILKLEDEQARFVAAIAIAGEVEALATALQAREQQRTRLQHDLVALDGLDSVSTFDVKHVERDLRKRLTEWRALLHRQTPPARQVLARILDGRIAWTPNGDVPLAVEM